eukprot:m.26126 g.26126  ORF g.26126 m.26126 type:complete len:180 (+) comp9873_c0_seq1:68-607(+)
MRAALVVLLLCVAAVMAADEERARLLVAKDISNVALVEGRDVVVKYSVHNIGTGSAFDVKITDDSFSKSQFDFVMGTPSAEFDVVKADESATHVFVIRPLFTGPYNFTTASVSYVAVEGEEPVVGLTSNPGSGEVMLDSDFARATENHLIEWICFAGIMLLIPIGIPYINSQNRISKRK